MSKGAARLGFAEHEWSRLDIRQPLQDLSSSRALQNEHNGTEATILEELLG